MRFHLMSQALLRSLSTMLVSFECQIYANNSPFLQWSFSIITWLFRQLHECPERKNNKSTRDSSKGIRVLSEYAKSLESSVKERYWQKALEAYQPYKMSLYGQSEKMSRWHFISFSEEHVRFKPIFVYFVYSFMLIVLYDVSLLVNTVYNLIPMNAVQPQKLKKLVGWNLFLQYYIRFNVNLSQKST